MYAFYNYGGSHMLTVKETNTQYSVPDDEVDFVDDFFESAKEIIVDDAYNNIISNLLAELFNKKLPSDGEISEKEIYDLIQTKYFGEPVGKNRDIGLDAKYWIHDYVMYGLYLGDKAKFKFSPNGDKARGVRQTGDRSGYLIVVNYNNQGVDHPIIFQITATSADSIFVQGGVSGNYIEKEMDANSAIQLLLNY